MNGDTSPAPALSRLLEMGFEQEPEPTPTVDAVRVDRRTVRVRAARPAMGTLVSITALARSRDQGEEAMGRAFEEMHRLIGVFSRFESGSAVSQLNDTGRLAGPPAELLDVVTAALRYHRTTNGLFDITVWPVLRLFGDRLGGRVPGAPSGPEVAEAMALVGAQRVEASRRALRFGREGMAVTVDGIAKGYIVDRMARALERRRVRHYLIDAGGDIRVSGRKEGRRPWTVAVRDPWDGGGFPDRLELTDGAVATSGSYERYFDPDRRYHHIVDAGVGHSPGASVSVTATAPTAMAADALATSLFIMAPAAALRFVDRAAGCECLVIDREGREHRSRGWRGIAYQSKEGEGQ